MSQLESLLQWIKNTEDENYKPSTHSFISPKTVVKDDGEWGRGICAATDVRNRELLMRIPPSFLLNYTTVLKHISKYNSQIKLQGSHYAQVYVPPSLHNDEDQFTEIYSKFELEELTNWSSFQLLSFFITFEMQRLQDSFWKPFLDMLPPASDFDLVPLTWHALKVPHYLELLNALPPSTRAHTDKVIKRFETDYSVVQACLQGKSDSPIDDLLPVQSFLWAWMCINSRCLYMDIPQKKNNSDNFTMAPYVDFLNHSCEDQCSLKIDTTGFQVYTGKSYTTGEQIFLSYGPHSNEFLICEYGFMLNDNRWNDLNITEQITRLLSRMQTEYLKELDYYGDYTINVESGPSFRTEVALATLQEPNPSTSRRLQAFVNGITDGSSYDRHSGILLDEILQQVKYSCTELPVDEEKDDKLTILRKKVIQKLWKDASDIIEGQ